MSQAIVDVAARDGALPENNRVLPQVLRIEREVSISQNIPANEFDQAYATPVGNIAGFRRCRASLSVSAEPSEGCLQLPKGRLQLLRVEIQKP
jgi:hypothetical protein